MYLNSLFVLLAMFGSSNIWRVEASTIPPPTTLSLLQSSTENQTDKPPQTKQDLLPVYIIEQHNLRFEDGSYQFSYVLSDNTVRSEQGTVVHGHPRNYLVVKGFYSYRLPDWRYLTVRYSADQNGYRQDSPVITADAPHIHH